MFWILVEVKSTACCQSSQLFFPSFLRIFMIRLAFQSIWKIALLAGPLLREAQIWSLFTSRIWLPGAWYVGPICRRPALC